ncbi:tapasin-related protein, partial [Zonotrichia leucophrys gambelii]|uniref:tapasin-related protein n=1 Tax=Zonotrichia leucophrys gambelii TaxID=257770 RepID=UPI0031404244
MAGARLLLAGLFQIWGGVAVFGEPPPALRCPLLDRRGAPAPRGALLRFLGDPGAPPHPETPPDPQNTFDVIDPPGTPRTPSTSSTPPGPPEHLRRHRPPGGPAGFLGSLAGAPPVRAEPHGAAAAAAPGAVPALPPRAGHALVAAGPGTPRREGTVLLQQVTAAQGDTARVNASLAISTLTPTLRGRLGTPQTLHCSFTPPAPGVPFTLEWLRHRDGATRRLLAFDSAANRVTEAAPGVLLLLGGHGDTPGTPPGTAGTQPPGGAVQVSLQLPPLSVSDDGSFVCSVATPLGQLQQVLRMNVIAPPQVSLVPSVLSPGVPARLRCDAVGFFPLDVGIRWERQARGDPRPRPVTPEGATATLGDSASSPGDSASATPGDSGAGLSWSSGHRRAADGTFSRSAGLSVAKGTAGDTYSCLVTHVAWDVPLRVTVQVA